MTDRGDSDRKSAEKLPWTVIALILVGPVLWLGLGGVLYAASRDWIGLGVELALLGALGAVYLAVLLRSFRAETESRVERELLLASREGLFDAVGEGAFVFDETFHCVGGRGVSWGSTEFSGEPVGRPLHEVVPGLPEKDAEGVRLRLRHGEPVERVDMPYRRNDGGGGFCTERYLPIMNREERFAGAAVFLEEITESKTIRQRLVRRSAMVESARTIAGGLLSGVDWDGELASALAGIGQATGVGRVCLYQNFSQGDSGPFAELMECWQEDGRSASEEIRKIPLGEESFKTAADVLRSRDPLLLDDAGDTWLSDRGAASLSGLAVYSNRKWWGFLTLELFEGSRTWSRSVSQFLGLAASIFEGGLLIRAEKEERKLHSLAVERAGESIVITDATGGIEYANPAFERITGYGRAEVLGRNIRILESGEHPPEFYVQFWDELAGGRGWSGRFINRKKDGTLYQQDTSIMPVRDANGRTQGFVGVGRDVTAEMAVEAQLRRSQKLESLGLLASGIAHDFNNVMGLVLGAAERLKDTVLDRERTLYYLSIIMDAIKRGQSVSRRMLAFYRDRDSKTEVFDLKLLIEELVEVGAHTFPRNIEVRVEGSRGASVVRADRSQIHQALMNLCINAVSAMASGGRITVGIRPARSLEANRHLRKPKGEFTCVYVGDTGAGMDAETVEKIFDPYFTTKRTGEGTGLGLSIVFAIVQAQGGWVDVESAVGQGSKFTVGLPASWETPEAEPESEAIEIQGGAGAQILVADDEAGIRHLLRDVLEENGYRVLDADDGLGALKLFKEHAGEIDVLVTDLGMAQMGGAELVRRVRAIDAEVPIVVTTGYMDPKLQDRFAKLGVKRLLSKPFRMMEILALLQEVLAESE